jgi:hypothetical protein
MVVAVSAHVPGAVRTRRAAVLAAVALLAACRGGNKEEAEQAVRTYLARLVEAYRTADVSLVDPLVSDQQALKLVGLIGVKQDAGVVLDAKIVDLQFVRAERDGAGWVVETKERWYYRDRKIGSGEQVGQDSTDSYAMRYRFVRKEGHLVLDDLEFVGEPVVGRKSAPMPVDVRVLHGLEQKAPDGEAPAGAAPAGEMPAGHPPIPPPKEPQQGGAGTPAQPARKP